MNVFGFLLTVGSFLWILTQFFEKIVKIFGKLPPDAVGTLLSDVNPVAPVIVAPGSSLGGAYLLVPTQAVRLPKAPAVVSPDSAQSSPYQPFLETEQAQDDAGNGDVAEDETDQSEDQNDTIPFESAPLQDADDQADYGENFILVTTYEGGSPCRIVHKSSSVHQARIFSDFSPLGLF